MNNRKKKIIYVNYKNKINMTTVINLIGAPGSGKTTIATDLFSKMKYLGYNVELVTEYAKELVWEQRHETFKNELYIFGKQHQRLFRLKDKVKFIITDRPLILSVFYNHIYGDKSLNFDNIVIQEVNKFNNINFFLERDFNYENNGRNQTEEESIEFSNIMFNMFTNKYNLNMKKLISNIETTQKILKLIENYKFENIISNEIESEINNFLNEVKLERIRQINDENYSLENDKKYINNELPRAAATYCLKNLNNRVSFWPWNIITFKPTNEKRDLIKASALIIAELQRIKNQ